MNSAHVTIKLKLLLTGKCVPDANCLIRATGHNRRTVMGHRHTVHRPAVVELQTLFKPRVSPFFDLTVGQSGPH